MMVGVVTLGDVNVDVIARFDQYPSQGQDALARSIALHCGGSAANASVAMARLGLAVRLIGRIGLDPWAAVALGTLRSANVVLDSLQRDLAAMTGLMYIVVTPDGERTMFCHRGANLWTNPGGVRGEQMRGARLFHLSGYALLAEPQKHAALRALDMAQREGLAVSLDPGLAVCQIAASDVRDLLPAVDILLPSLAEAQLLSDMDSPEDCALALLRRGVQAVAIKLGRNGCLIGTSSGTWRLPAFCVEAQDTTGAGDSFAAGLIAGFLGGLNWLSAALLGNAAGGLATSRVGAEMPANLPQAILELLTDPGQAHVRDAFPEASASAIRWAQELCDKLNS